MPLTNVVCLNAKAKPKAYKITDFQGLYLEVMPQGSKYWRLKYRFLGKEKRLALGVYPTVSLAEARERRDAARKQLGNNIDPGAFKKEQKLKAALAAATTFEAVAREWHNLRKPKWSPQYADEILNRFEVDIFPCMGNDPISSLRPVRLLTALRKIEDRGASHVAHRVLGWTRQVFQYAEVTERVDRDITPAVKAALSPCSRGHYAALEIHELPDFLRALKRNNARLFPLTRLAVELLMFTFVRTTELIEAKWDEVDFDIPQWTIPIERMKMRRHAPWSHIVPLSTHAVSILRELHKLTGRGNWIFPGRASPQRCMSENTILKALDLLGYKRRMTGHGFRALAKSTIKEKLLYRDEVVELQLAHTSGDPYDRAKYLDERQKMMQDWGDLLDKMAQENSISAHQVRGRKTLLDGGGTRQSFS
jgi:integrase